VGRSPGRRPGTGSLGDVTRIDRHRLDDHRIHRTITSPSSYLGDVVDDIPTGLVSHLAEDRVLAVEVRLRADGDEELRAVSARPRVGHGKQIRLVEGKIRMDFVSELVTRTAGASPEWATSLNHETVDHSMKGEPVIEVAGCRCPGAGIGVLPAAGREAYEVVHCLGSLITEEQQSDITVIGVQSRRLLCHVRHLSVMIIIAMIGWTWSGSHPVRPNKMAIRWEMLHPGVLGFHNGGNVSKSSRRAKAARKEVVPAAEDFVHSAADRVGPLVHTAADRVGPLAQSAADRVAPLAGVAADRIGAAADKVSPLAHSAADRLGPLAQSAADRVGPITHDAAERLAPLAHSAADRIAPLTNQAIDRVSPYAQQAVSKVSPYAHQAAERIGPMASTAKQQGARVAHDALEKIAPVLDEALEKISPAVEAARGKVSDDILPKLSELLSAAAGTPVVVEATKRGKAAVAAAKGELELPEKKKKSRWVMRIAVVAAIAGAAVFVIRRFLGSRDADWQAARPTTPYAPPRPAETSHSAESAATAAAPTVDGADAGDDPQGGLSAHLVNVEADGAAVPDQPAEGGDVEAPAEAITEIEESLFETSVGEETPTEAAPESEIAEPVMADIAEAAVEADPDAVSANEATEAVAAAMASPRYEGEGVYVGHEPPDGFTIKGNERSMKYHVPESSGYGRTIAEVWFNSEEAAQQAGFVRAHR